MLSSIQSYQFKRILPFGVIWFLLGALFLAVEEMAIGNFEKTDESAIRLDLEIVVYALIGIFIIGCIFGAIHTLWLDKKFKRQSYSKRVIYEFVIYLAFVELVLLINYPIVASMEENVSLLDNSVWERLSLFFFSITHISALVQMAFSILASLFYHELSNTVGQNVIFNFFTGKYHQPVQEARIFMFADMKDSTTIAEQLGNQDYFRFLQDYYESFSNAIISSNGEVYQYVGDEIVISWPFDRGVQSNNCVECFFRMKRDLLKEHTEFQKRFSIQPDFKASLHYGTITTGEIGALKKDIFFTGDVLNTTARILSKTSEYEEDLLISDVLAQKMDLSEDYLLSPLGDQELKGKKERVKILSVNKA